MTDILYGANVDSGNVRVAVVVYRKRGILVFNLKKYKTKETLIEAINNLKMYRAKQGNVASGMDMIKTKVLTEKAGDRLEDAPNVVVLLTDANSKADIKKIQSSAKALRDVCSKVYTIGIGVQDVTQLQEIASSPKDSYNVDTFARLSSVQDEVIKQVHACKRSACFIKIS